MLIFVYGNWRVNRVDNLLLRSRSEREVIEPGGSAIPSFGYRWVELSPDSFRLVPNASELPSWKIRKFSGYLYLDFYKLNVDRTAIQAFANTHGWLVLVHGSPDENGGEPFTLWAQQVQEFKSYFDGWRAVQDLSPEQSKRALLAFMQRVIPKYPLERRRNTPIEELKKRAQELIIRRVNEYLRASAPDGTALVRLLITQRGQTFVPVLIPSNVLGAVWLQFSQVITGTRILQHCELCKDLMDITDSAHPGSKRMHSRCSNRIRKQRYRSKKREENG